MYSRVIFSIACLVAAAVPLLTGQGTGSTQPDSSFPGWPSTILGRTLRKLPLTDRETAFAADLPGRTGRFTDGTREYIIRWISSVNRQYHSASQCLEAVGFTLHPLMMHTASDNTRWSSFSATRNDEELIVYERIYDGTGKSWTDFIEWYWAAIAGKTIGPWWSVTIAEHAE